MKFLLFFFLFSSMAFAGTARKYFDYENGQTVRLTMGDVDVSFSVRVSGSYVYFWRFGREYKLDKVFGTDTQDSNRTFLFEERGCSFYYVDSSGVGPGKFRIAVLWPVEDIPAPTPPPAGYDAFKAQPTPLLAPRW